MLLVMFSMLALPLGLIVHARLVAPLGLAQKTRFWGGIVVVLITLLAGSAVPICIRYAKDAETYIKFGFERWTPWLYYFVTFLCMLLFFILIRDTGLLIYRCIQWIRERRAEKVSQSVPQTAVLDVMTDKTSKERALASVSRAENAKRAESVVFTRRQFLNRISSAAVVGGALIVTPGAVYYSRDKRVVKNIEVKLSSISAGLDGLRIVHLSDIHVGNTIRREDVEAIVAETNALEPDIVAITGDLCEGHAEFIGSWLEPLKDLKPRYGAYFVTGNHDHMWGARAWNKIITEQGIRVLNNEHEILDIAGTKLAVCGVIDLRGDRKERRWQSNPDAAMLDIEPDIFKLMLAHQPGSAEACFKAGADLMLVGHTHGGQFWPLCYVVDAVHKYSRGLYYVDDKAIFVSCGTGYWGPPLRFGVPPEIDVITLRSKNS